MFRWFLLFSESGIGSIANLGSVPFERPGVSQTAASPNAMHRSFRISKKTGGAEFVRVLSAGWGLIHRRQLIWWRSWVLWSIRVYFLHSSSCEFDGQTVLPFRGGRKCSSGFAVSDEQDVPFDLVSSGFDPNHGTQSCPRSNPIQSLANTHAAMFNASMPNARLRCRCLRAESGFAHPWAVWIDYLWERPSNDSRSPQFAHSFFGC